MRIKEGGDARELLSLRSGAIRRARLKKADTFARVQGPVPLLAPSSPPLEVATAEPILLANGDRTLRITLISPVLVRIEEIAPGQRFVDDPTYFAMNRGVASPGLKYRRVEKAGATIIDTGAMRLELRPDGQPLSENNLRVRGKGWRWDPSKANDDRRNLGGAIRTLDLFGVGEEKDQHGGLKLENGIISTQGFFCFDDSRGPIFADGGYPRRRKNEERGSDRYLFGYGRDYRAAIEALAAIGGAVPMPNGAMLGAIDSWYQPLSDDQYRARVESYLEHGYPLDAMAFDIEALRAINPACNWSRWTWNYDLVRDPRALNEFLHAHKITTFLNLHPHGGVACGERGYEALMEALKRNGFDDSGAESGKTVAPDFADPRYVEPWIENVLEPLKRDGVDIWWPDYQSTEEKEPWRGQPKYTAIDNLQTGAQLAYVLSSRASKDRKTILTRFEGLGSHRYPMQFSGDTYVQFPVLGAQVRMTAASGNVLASFWSHDIGGHLHQKQPELLARWTWFGALSACLRMHACDHSGADPRPWLYGKECEESTRRAYRLRSELFPYIYSQVWNCHARAMPLIQPMYLSCPGQRQAYKNPQQYMLGESVLVAPIVREGQGPGKVASEVVWFPRGAWYDVLTRERFEGGQRRIVSAALDEVPVFAKGGVPIAMQPVSLHMGSEQVRTLIVRAFPGRDGERGESVLHEDDRLTQAHREGGFASTALAYQRTGDRVTMTVGATEGTFAGQPEERELRFELPATSRATRAWIDGELFESIEYDPQTQTNTVALPARSIRNGVTVEVEALEAGPEIAASRALERRMFARFGDVEDRRPLFEQIAARAAELGVEANAEDDDRLRGLLELAGIGFETPEDGPYGWSPYGARLLQPFYPGASEVRIAVEDQSDEGTKRVFARALSPHRSGRYNFPLPALESDGGKVSRAVTMRFTVAGQEIRWTKTLAEVWTRRAFAPTNPDPNDPLKTHPRDITPEVRVNGFRVDEMDRIGLVALANGKTSVDRAIRRAVGKHHGPKGIGYPADNGGGTRLAHRWIEHGVARRREASARAADLRAPADEGGAPEDRGVTIQDFDWGAPEYRGRSAVLHADGAKEAFVIRGDFWRAYTERVDERCVGLETLGLPIGDEMLLDGQRTQRFERGSIVEREGRPRIVV